MPSLQVGCHRRAGETVPRHRKSRQPPHSFEKPLAYTNFPSACTYFQLALTQRAALRAGRQGWDWRLVCVWRAAPQRSHPGTRRRSARQNAASRCLSRRSAAPAPPRPPLQRPLAREAVPAHARGGRASLTTGRVGRAGRARVGWRL